MIKTIKKGVGADKTKKLLEKSIKSLRESRTLFPRNRKVDIFSFLVRYTPAIAAKFVSGIFFGMLTPIVGSGVTFSWVTIMSIVSLLL